MQFLKIILFLNGIFSCHLQATKVSFASPRSTLTRLGAVEEKLIKNLEEYAKELKNKLKIAKGALASFEAELLKARTVDGYLENPLNGFKLIRHQHWDWRKWATYTSELPGKDQIIYAGSMRQVIPNSEELKQASSWVKLPIVDADIAEKELAAGRTLEYEETNSTLNALDCYAMGKYHISRKHHLQAELWMNFTLAKLDDSNPIMDKLFAFSKNALYKWIGVLLEKRKQIAAAHHFISKYDDSKFDRIIDWYAVNADIRDSCGARLKRQTHLHCRYNNWMVPFLWLAPLKMEELNTEPMVMLYHDVLYDSEFEYVAGKQNFEPSLVNMNEISDYRTAQDASLSLMNDEMQTIKQRMSDMTGFVVGGSEQGSMTSLINYGIGGQYNLHMDSFGFDVADIGDRIATVLFYVKTVELGGATVFPYLNLTVPPVKGTALVWHNLDNGMQPDTRASHSGCPVIVGAKYVLTHWIYSADQMFIKPCQENGKKSA